MIILGNRAFKEVIRINEVIRVGPRPKRIGVLVGGGDTRVLSLSAHTEPCAYTGRRWLFISQEGASAKISPAGTLTLDFQSL